MDRKDIAALLALMRVEGAGNTVARRAINMAQLLGMSVADAVLGPARDLVPLLPPNVFDAVLNAARRLNDDALERADRHVQRVLQHGVQCFAYTDESYPHLLGEHLSDAAPALLWCVGNLELLQGYGAGIVGTREPSPTGEAIAADCARLFVKEHACVVSGGADGIDSVAHRAALDAGGSTIIVLPMGIRMYSFPGYVRDAIEAGRCAIVSQFDPEMTWQTHAAVTRNATIAALSKLVCVVEPKRMGGSMRTAKHAREQGKKVFYYCGEGGEEFARTLNQAGAIALVSVQNELNTVELLAQWGNEIEMQPQQQELV
ncbi:MAG: DNA-processing protein DprA [Candidatus Hydrogenedentes bacterium]|nr:DNA-processing protein DprA [Candidatus Hydrogenedentota bacterium]